VRRRAAGLPTRIDSGRPRPCGPTTSGRRTPRRDRGLSPGASRTIVLPCVAGEAAAARRRPGERDRGRPRGPRRESAPSGAR
jgi:hypothetical protein